MSLLDELFVSLLHLFEARAMDYDLARIPAPKRRVIWSRRVRELRLKFEER